MPRTLRVPALMSSRFSERKLARNTTTSTLAISPGWKVNDSPIWIQSLDPLRSTPTMAGRTSSATPMMPMVYL